MDEMAQEKSLLKLVVEQYALNQKTTMGEIASELCMSPSALSLKLDKKRRLTLDEAVQLAGMLGMPTDTLYNLFVR